MCCSFDIRVKAAPLDVVHYTVDPEDPSNGVCLSTRTGAWQGNMLMNQPRPRSAAPGASKAEQQRYVVRAHFGSHKAAFHHFQIDWDVSLSQHAAQLTTYLSLSIAQHED